MRITLQFSGYGDAGANNGMLQQATLAGASGRPDVAHRLRESAAALSLIGAITLASVILLYSGSATSDRVLWLLLAGLVIPQNMWQNLQVALRSQKRNNLCSSLSILIAMMSTVLGVAGAYAFGLMGFLVALALSYLVGFVATSLLQVPIRFPSLDLAAARLLVRAGLPITAGDLLKLLMWNVDKILIWALLGKPALGIYALQSTITSAVMLLPAGVAEVFYPHVVSQLGQERKPALMARYVTDGAELLSRSMLPLLAVVYLCFHLPVRWLLPDYIDTVTPGRILVLATFFPIFGTVTGAVLLAMGGQRQLFTASLAGVLVATTGVWLAIHFGAGFAGIALGAAAGLMTRACCSAAFVVGRIDLSPTARRRLVLRSVAGFGLLLAAVTAANLIVPDSPASPSSDILATAGRCLIALCILAPSTFGVWRAHQQWSSSSSDGDQQVYRHG
jgi:O-antigen/teichoic acid export membrane protein